MWNLRDLFKGDSLDVMIDTNLAGTKDKPITIRAYPNELVILDEGGSCQVLESRSTKDPVLEDLARLLLDSPN